MKNSLMMILAAGGMFFATSSDANAQSWRTRGSGIGVSLNFGNPGYGYNNYRGYRNIDRGYIPPQGYGYGYGHPGYSRSVYPRYNDFYSPSHRYVTPRRSYGYGCRYGY